MVEYQSVMTRGEHLVASGLSTSEVGILLDAVASVGEPVRLTGTPLLRLASSASDFRAIRMLFFSAFSRRFKYRNIEFLDFYAREAKKLNL
jgi:hypothetical protein